MIKLLPTPIGNLQDITIRTLEALKAAEYVFCEDTRVSKRLLYLLNEKLNIEFGEKQFVSLHSHNELEQIDNYAEQLKNHNCVYISDAGMPCISDPGLHIVRFCQINEISYEVLPGANALLPAYCASGFDGAGFMFYGFLPHKQADRRDRLKELLNANSSPIIFYESPHRLIDFLKDISELFEHRELFLAKELTKMHETFYKDSALNLYKKLKREKILGEWVVVVCSSDEKPKNITMTLDELSELTLPKKELAKLISKVTGESPKQIYERLL